jgi:hypothetical protein
MADFKAALRVAMKAMTIVLPFNHSVSAIESFMENSVYCAEKTAHLSDKERAQELTAFVDHVFHTNSRRWVAKQGFLTATELAPVFQSWIGSRPAGRLAAVAASTPATAAVSEDSKPGGSHYNYNYNRRGGKNKNHGGWNNNSGFFFFLKIFNCYLQSQLLFTYLVIFSTGYFFTTTFPRQQYPLQKRFFILKNFLTSAYFL